MGKDVLILPDNDESGSKYLAKVIECLSKLKAPPSIMVVELPDLPDKGDAADWVAGALANSWIGWWSKRSRASRKWGR